MTSMQYRRLGNAGLKLSELSFGSWVTFKTQLGDDTVYECMKAAYDAGVNFFDNAEAYAGGQSEELMGSALKKLGWRRGSYVISTKLFWGLNDGPNEKNTLNRKYLLEAMNGALKRFDQEYVDLVFCHRADPNTPMEEIVWTMNDIITQGKALYWGTSEWSADQIRQAWEVADKLRLRKPQMEQSQYNMFARERVEKEYTNLYADTGIGNTIWSPLAGGLLSGKYNNGIPADSRAKLKGYEWFANAASDQDKINKVKQLDPIAKDLGGTLAQLALAWCAKNPHVTSVITGASKPEQVVENMKAIDLIPKLTPEIMTKIDEILGKA